MRELLVLAVVIATSACGGDDAVMQPRRAEAPAPPPPSGDLTISVELRKQLPKGSACGAGDACGFFLQLISPGSDPHALATRAANIARGKCSGQIVVYRDGRNVMGAGIVLPTLDAKHACEGALGRPADTDFPRALVLRVQP
jgi:hypothetical protein